MEQELDELKGEITDYLVNLTGLSRQPSGAELLESVEKYFGWKAGLVLVDVIAEMIEDKKISRFDAQYFMDMIDPDSEFGISAAKKKREPVRKPFMSTFDLLLNKGRRYRKTDEFRELVEFMSSFKRYSPYNNMLVKIQNPYCSFYASQYDWKNKFGRTIKEDARPMLILAPMHPVMLVYDLDSTEGRELPKDLLEFAQFDGEWDSRWLEKLSENANNHMIKISYKPHSSTHAGSASLERTDGAYKMRISIHDELDEPSKFGVLCHELAHIFLGHLGSDEDRWWPHRQNLTHASVEIEAEAVAYTVTKRLGLEGSSISYVSKYLKEDYVPEGISIDYIAKIAAKIEDMVHYVKPAPKRKSKK